MAALSPYNSASLQADRSSFSSQAKNGLPSSDRGLGLCRNQQSLSMHALINGSTESQQLSCDPQLGSFVSRSRKGVVISGFVIAAATAFGLSMISIDGLALATEGDVNSTAVVSGASPRAGPIHGASSTRSPREIENPNPALDSSIRSNPASNFSFSMSIPIPHEQEWIIIKNGNRAPLPRHGISNLKCPPWTPKDLEMFLPDFNGRPKPFPRQGHHWSASFVVSGAHNEAFIELTDFREDVESDTGTTAKVSSMAEAKLDTQEVGGKPALLKVLGMDKFICFSM